MARDGRGSKTTNRIPWKSNRLLPRRELLAQVDHLRSGLSGSNRSSSELIAAPHSITKVEIVAERFAHAAGGIDEHVFASISLGQAP